MASPFFFAGELAADLCGPRGDRGHIGWAVFWTLSYGLAAFALLGRDPLHLQSLPRPHRGRSSPASTEDADSDQIREIRGDRWQGVRSGMTPIRTGCRHHSVSCDVLSALLVKSSGENSSISREVVNEMTKSRHSNGRDLDGLLPTGVRHMERLWIRYSIGPVGHHQPGAPTPVRTARDRAGPARRWMQR